MRPEADGVLSTLNALINSREALTTLLVALVVGVVTWAASTFRRRRRFGWSVLYDEWINQGDPLARPATGLAPGPSQNMWEIEYLDRDRSKPPYPVRNGSLVVIELRNIGREPIRESDFGEKAEFSLKFPGRRVVHFKVRDNDLYHKAVHETSREAPQPGAGDSFTLPALQMNHGDGFKLAVLLETPAPQPSADDRAEPKFIGSILNGDFVPYSRHPRRMRTVAITVVGLALVAGTVVGVALANRALTPAPTCASGKLNIDGSTAFAPIVNEVATEYEQDCPGAQITVRSDGSVQGLSDLERNSGKTPVIAMYDGLPPQPPDPQFVSQPVGIIIFAVVGNRSLPANLFTAGTGGGLTDQQIVQAFADPRSGGLSFAPVGRSSASGTRGVFVRDVLNGNDSSEQGAGPCPPARGVCLEPTTMSLLTYVNATPNALGYAEADALPFFPDVGAIPVNGFMPSRANALDGSYSFLATEHLYTNGIPAGLTADLIDFLTSKAVTAQLRDTSFIGCSDTAGSKLSC
jgi:ABC-type phosphate transport system substrate-binding protein